MRAPIVVTLLLSLSGVAAADTTSPTASSRDWLASCDPNEGPKLDRALQKGIATVDAGRLELIARYSPIASGASLQAVDIKSGATRWTADVVQLSVAHSQYWNEVTLA